MSAAVPLVAIEGLKVVFRGDRGRATHAVDCVDLDIARGATLGLVGESGCGKSATALAIMRLLPTKSAEVSGTVRFDGIDLLGLPDDEVRDLRATGSP
jgi:peptide/nickel transport system ATP-binding protein